MANDDDDRAPPAGTAAGIRARIEARRAGALGGDVASARELVRLLRKHPQFATRVDLTLADPASLRSRIARLAVQHGSPFPLFGLVDDRTRYEQLVDYLFEVHPELFPTALRVEKAIGPWTERLLLGGAFSGAALGSVPLFAGVVSLDVLWIPVVVVLSGSLLGGLIGLLLHDRLKRRIVREIERTG